MVPADTSVGSTRNISNTTSSYKVSTKLPRHMQSSAKRLISKKVSAIISEHNMLGTDRQTFHLSFAEQDSHIGFPSQLKKSLNPIWYKSFHSNCGVLLSFPDINSHIITCSIAVLHYDIMMLFQYRVKMVFQYDIMMMFQNYCMPDSSTTWCCFSIIIIFLYDIILVYYSLTPWWYFSITI